MEGRERREFARIDVAIAGGVCPVDDEQADRLRAELAQHPSVWAPSVEGALLEMVNGASGGTQAVMSQALLELAEQVVRLRAHALDGGDRFYSVQITQLSGGGGRFTTRLPLDDGELLALRFDVDCENGAVPPVRALIRVVYNHDDGSIGFTYDAIHPKDRERMIRLIYRLQRQALRAAHHEA